MTLSSKKIHDNFWKNTSEEKYKENGPVSRHLQNLMFAILETIQFNSVLDVGCGQASVLGKIKKKYPQKEYSGVDISNIPLKIAKKRYPTISFVILDISKKNLPKKFDLVIMLDVLEHIQNDTIALKNVRHMVGKYLLVSTVVGRMREGEEVAGHVRNYTEKDLVDKLTKSGFKTKKIIRWGFPFYSPFFRDTLELISKSKKKNAKNPEENIITTWPWYVDLFAQIVYSIMKLNIPNKGDFIWILSQTKK